MQGSLHIIKPCVPVTHSNSFWFTGIRFMFLFALLRVMQSRTQA